MRLKDSLSNEPVSRLALRDPVLCLPDEAISEAVSRMRDRKLGCVIVVDDERRPVGLFTENMLSRLVASDPSGLRDKLRARMAEQCHCVRPTDPVARVLEAMQRSNTRFVCVVDDDGKVVGLTGQKGLMEFIADHFPQQVMVQRVGSPPPSQREGA
ncbi:CBS domain-containing protein [Botrimarina sp.]|uniref:CBS domain-containing protein n=1 Tax=Botrimarina sp. TaxID=2795802 RepID=UPI0032ED90F3